MPSNDTGPRSRTSGPRSRAREPCEPSNSDRVLADFVERDVQLQLNEITRALRASRCRALMSMISAAQLRRTTPEPPSAGSLAAPFGGGSRCLGGALIAGREAGLAWSSGGGDALTFGGGPRCVGGALTAGREAGVAWSSGGGGAWRSGGAGALIAGAWCRCAA